MFPRFDDQRETTEPTGVPLPGLDRRPYATWALLAINAAMFLIAQVSGGSTNVLVLLDLGAMQGQAIAAGEYWRLLTAVFLHSGWMHLGLNCFGLFVFGQQLEQLYGHGRYVALYLLAGLAGSVASYALNLSLASNAIGVGASGAIFGVLGGLVAFFMSHRDRLGDMGRRTLIGLLLLAGINLAYGLATQGVDNYAHMGGLVAGVLLGLAFSPHYRPVLNVFGLVSQVVDSNSIIRRWWALPVVGAVLVVGVVVGDQNVGESPIPHLQQAREFRQESDLTRALDELDMAIAIAPDFGPIYLERALVMAELGNIDRAITDAGLAVRYSQTPADQQTAVRLLVRLRGGR